MSNSNRKHWVIAAGDERRDYSDLFLRHGIMLVGPGDYGDYFKNEKVYRRMREHRVHRFVREVQRGDIVVLKRGVKSIIAAGTVDKREDSYFHKEVFSDVLGFSLQHGRYVTWHKPEKEIPFGGLRQGTIYQPDKSLTHVKQIAERIINENPPRKPEKIPLPPKEVDDEELIKYLIERGLGSGQAEDVIRAFWRIRRLGSWYEGQVYEGGVNVSEHETRTFLVVPLLLALGWPEQRMKIEWNKLDIGLFETNYAQGKEPTIIVESKKLNEPIQSAEKQAKKYSQKYPDCKKLVVSNGIKYKLFEKENDEWTPRAYLNLSKLLEKHPYDDRIDGAPELLAKLLP